MFRKIALWSFVPLLVLAIFVPNFKTSADDANLILNPSFENGTTAPTNWAQDYWGSPVPTFKYPEIGRSGSDKAVSVSLAQNSDGDARWSHQVVSVTAGDSYNYSEWYKSNVETEIDAEYANASGALSY